MLAADGYGEESGRKPGLPGGHPIEAKVVVMFFVAKAVGDITVVDTERVDAVVDTAVFRRRVLYVEKTICPSCLSCTVAPV